MTRHAATLQVVPVQGEEDLQNFLRLPWSLYQDDPYWVPPLLAFQRRFLNPAYGHFFEIGEAQLFLAYRRGRPVGRVSAHLNHRYEHYQDGITGFFGFFECVQDLEVAQALFEAAAQWLRGHGKQRLLGPLNFTIYDELGLLVEGFDTLPAVFQTYNPPYYLDLLESLGFRKAFDWYALCLTERHRRIDVTTMEKRLDNLLARQSLVLTSYRHEEIQKRAEEAFELFNEAWAPNWGHVPATRKQFDTFMKDIRPLLRPGLVNLLLHEDRLVGFSISIPDLNPLVQEFNGRLTLWGKMRLLYAARFAPLHKVRGLMVGISQPYQHRKLHHAMIMRTYLYLVKHTPCTFYDFSLIPENLPHWLKTLESFGARRYKTFRLLEKPI